MLEPLDVFMSKPNILLEEADIKKLLAVLHKAGCSRETAIEQGRDHGQGIVFSDPVSFVSV